MAQGVEKLQNFLACTCVHKVHQVILFSSHKWSSILYLLLDYITHSTDFSLTDRNLPLGTAFRQCIWPRPCPLRLASGKTFSHPKKKEEDLKRSNSIPFTEIATQDSWKALLENQRPPSFLWAAMSATWREERHCSYPLWLRQAWLPDLFHGCLGFFLG